MRCSAEELGEVGERDEAEGGGEDVSAMDEKRRGEMAEGEGVRA